MNLEPMEYEIAVSQTFAYLFNQLDFPPSRRIRAHFVEQGQNYTLCGYVLRGWETVSADSVEGEAARQSWLCKHCEKIANKEAS